MASNLDSVAVFKNRCNEIGLPSAIYDAILAAGYATYSTFAYCSQYIPGTQDEREFVRTMEAAIGRPPAGAELAILRRLVTEAHTFVMADMRLRIERGDEATPRKMAIPERRVRQEQQQLQLGAALVIAGELEPSHWLIDEVEQQREDNVLRWIQPDKCCSRTQELQGEKREARFKFDPVKGTFTATAGQDPTTKANVSGELLVRNAFIRRALAYDQSGLLSYTVHMAWVDSLFKRMHDPVIANYQTIQLSQCMAADKELWVKLSEATSGSMVPVYSAGAKPLDGPFNSLKDSHSVAFLLLPLPVPPPAVRYERTTGGKGNKKDTDGKSGKGVKKNAKKADGKTLNVPEELKEFSPTTDDGKYICWGYNMNGCKFGSKGKNPRCKRGLHVCIRCHEQHSLRSCPQASSASGAG